ncbi:MAG: glycosyltransferase [Streptosporangiaceae bacterium]
MSKQSLLLVSESYWPNLDGGAIFEHGLAHALKSLGWRVYVWAPSPTGIPYVEDDNGVTTIRESSRTLRSNPRYRVSRFPIFRAQHIFQLTNPDVIHIHNFGPLGVLAQKYARMHRVPVIATNHNVAENWTSNFFRRRIALAEAMVAAYLAYMLNRVNIVVSPTTTADRILAAWGVATKRLVISNGVDTQFFQPPCQAATPVDHLRLVHVGRLDREKTCQVLIRAAAQASHARSLTLTVVGDGVERPRLERLAWDLERTAQAAAGFVRFLGHVSEVEKLRTLQSSDLFVTASQVELQGIAVLESMACGVPVLAPDAGALPELCRTGYTGILFEPGNVKDCAMKLATIEQSLLQQLGQAACSFVRAQHDVRKTHDSYARLLSDVASKRGRL